ncbi:hypothetical protein PCASD_16974 [Puccinia coronata f. sp. avenae]|uniref:Uncharacterized protein n=1 Tax=Puccinia coronata f. sp. avenae TaxID=200324 RepID=A0A2N5U2W6_9BASI|nr:hypothetical protein PCASD_16974 [Puccinia coronata f. sp. avenae]
MAPPNQGSVVPTSTRSPLPSEGAQIAQIGSTVGAMRTPSGNSLGRYDPIAGGTACTRVSSATSLGNQQHVVPANHRLPTLGKEGESQGLDLNSDFEDLPERDPSRAGHAQRLEDPSFLPLDIETVDRLQTLPGINNDNQRLVIDLCSMLASLPASLPTAPVLPVAPGPWDHHYHSTIRNICRQQIRSILMEPALEAYTRMHDPDGRMYNHTPLACMRRWIATQTTAFMADYLPNQYEQGDTVAVASVNAFLRNLVKHERTTMRNLDQIRPNDAIERQMTPALRVRIAMIRMITAHYYLHRPPGDNQLQWDVIDDQLERIRTWSDHTKHAFTRLLMRQDRELFTG